MDVDLGERAMLYRVFGGRVNQVIIEDIENLPPAGRLYPKFYVKVKTFKSKKGCFGTPLKLILTPRGSSPFKENFSPPK